MTVFPSRWPRLGLADWRRDLRHVIARARSRRAVIGGTLFDGVIVALATYPAQQPRLRHRREHRHTEGAARSNSLTAIKIGR